MKNLVITIQILSPIVLPKEHIHLDALLYSELNDFDTLATVLKFDAAMGVFRASAMRFGQYPENNIFYSLVGQPTVTAWKDFNYEFSKPKKLIETKGGPYRKKLTKKNAINAPFVQFHAVGNAEKIQYLLSCVGFIGCSYNQGYGEIGSIDIQEIEEDFSIYDETNSLARILPSSSFEGDKEQYLERLLRHKPNYANSELTMCVTPNFRLFTQV